MNRFEAVGTCILKTMLRIPYVNKVSNTEVFKRAKTERKLLQVIKERKAIYFGHFLRGEKYELARL